jgi:hypothetical protein
MPNELRTQFSLLHAISLLGDSEFLLASEAPRTCMRTHQWLLPFLP